jgi:hypothetical protein
MFERRESDILEAARRGDLTLAEQLGQAREASVLQRPFAEIAGTTAATNRFANPFAAGSQLLQSFQGPLSNYAAQRQAELQARMGTAQSRSASSAGLGQLAGSLALAGAYAYSDRRLKRNIERVGTHAYGIPLYAFDYVWGGPRMLGVMADELAVVRPDLVSEIGGYLCIKVR